MRALLLLAAVCALAAPAAAGTISITISQQVALSEDKLTANLKVGNTGDEAALSVTPSLRFGDQVVRGKGKDTLAPNTSFEETLTLPVGSLGEGRWPYRIAVDYTDQNQYPFQALQTQAVLVGSPPPAKIAVPAMKSADIAGTGTLALTVKNLTGDPHTARVSVFVPEGLEATDPVREVKLEGWKEQVLEVPITNRTALDGSHYPVFVAVEYDDGGVHEAAVAQGMASVVGANTFLDRNAGRLRVGAIGLVAVWLFWTARVYLRRRNRPGSASAPASRDDPV
jgi:hypothetical protein